MATLIKGELEGVVKVRTDSGSPRSYVVKRWDVNVSIGYADRSETLVLELEAIR